MTHVDFNGCSLDDVVELFSFPLSVDKVSCSV